LRAKRIISIFTHAVEFGCPTLATYLFLSLVSCL
jgi:hypothetical protein